MIEKFSLERVNKAPASFDPKKLQAFEDWHLQQLPLEQKIGHGDAVSAEGRAGRRRRRRPTQRQIVAKVVAAAGDRIKVAGDILAFADFFLPDDQLAYDEKAFDKHLRKADAAALLAKFRDRLADRRAVRRCRRSKRRCSEFVAAEGIKIGQIIHAAPRGRDRQVRRPRAVRHAGHSGQEPIAGANRPGNDAGVGFDWLLVRGPRGRQFSEAASGVTSAYLVSARPRGFTELPL